MHPCVGVAERPEKAPVEPSQRSKGELGEPPDAPDALPVATSVAVLERPAPVAAPSPILIPAPSPARSFTVELRFGTTSPHTIKTHKGSLYIGRATFNDLVIDEECIMRRHAHIYRLEQGVFMELLSSGATATINGGAANHISLICDGDVIGLGPCDAIIGC